MFGCLRCILPEMVAHGCCLRTWLHASRRCSRFGARLACGAHLGMFGATVFFSIGWFFQLRLLWHCHWSSRCLSPAISFSVYPHFCCWWLAELPAFDRC